MNACTLAVSALMSVIGSECARLRIRVHYICTHYLLSLVKTKSQSYSARAISLGRQLAASLDATPLRICHAYQ
jgi:hypothetical protein